MKPDDAVGIRINAGEGGLRFVAGGTRADLDADEMLRFALVRAIEIIGGATSRMTPETRSLERFRMNYAKNTVFPAQAGTQRLQLPELTLRRLCAFSDFRARWVPAFAGMTVVGTWSDSVQIKNALISSVPWSDVILMRNRLVHLYFDIDHEIKPRPGRQTASPGQFMGLCVRVR